MKANHMKENINIFFILFLIVRESFEYNHNERKVIIKAKSNN